MTNNNSVKRMKYSLGEKQLATLIQAMPVPQWEVITPAKAQEYLSHNAAENRSKKMVHIDKYARDMRAGNWIPTHQGIAFDKDGILLDGQQRLNAVIKANLPVPFLVYRGLDHETIKVMDQGVGRSLSDAMKMDKESCESLRSRAVTSGISVLFHFDFGHNICLSQAEVKHIYDFFKHECDMVSDLCGSRKNYPGPVAAAILAALIAGEDVKTVYRFCHGFDGKLDISNGAPEQWDTQIQLKSWDKTPYSKLALFYGTQQAIKMTRPDSGYDRSEKILIPDTRVYDIREKLMECIQG